MNNTYAIKTADGKTHYVVASSARQARIIWTRANNEEIVSIHVCRDAMA